MRGVGSVPIDLMGGILVAMGVIVGSVLLRFLVAYARARDRNRNDALRRAATQTGQWTIGVAVGIGSAVALGLVQFGDIVGTLFGFIGGHPFFASNLGVIGLGAGALSGLVSLSTDQYIGVALMIVGATFLFTQVDDAI